MAEVIRLSEYRKKSQAHHELEARRPASFMLEYRGEGRHTLPDIDAATRAMRNCTELCFYADPHPQIQYLGANLALKGFVKKLEDQQFQEGEEYLKSFLVFLSSPVVITREAFWKINKVWIGYKARYPRYWMPAEPRK